MDLLNKRILWLVDYTNFEVPAGGAEITDFYVLEAAKILGYNVKVVRPRDLRSNILNKSDLVIFSNCYEFPKAARERVMETKPYIVYSHDSGRWMSVLKDHPNMMQKALATVFLSPLHKDCFKNFLSGREKILFIPPHIPYNFYDYGMPRVNKVMFVGNIHDGKGIPSIIHYARNNPEMVFDFYYKRGTNYLIKELKALKNCNLIGYVPKEEIYNNYNKYEYFIHIPNHFEAFGRAVGEAFLCGCKLIVNNRVGAISYHWDHKNFRLETAKAHFSFWHKLNRLGSGNNLFSLIRI